MSENRCGSCTLCCKLLEIPVLNKPQGQWCTHCAAGQGCTIYEKRPAPCRGFECLWLESQKQKHPLPAALRPDRCKVVLTFTPDRQDVLGYCDPASPDDWKEPGLFRLLTLIAEQGHRVMMGNGRAHFVLDQGRARPVELAEPDAQGVRLFRRFLD
jgi:hypothetical protein